MVNDKDISVYFPYISRKMNGESVPNWLPVDPNFATAAIHSGYIPKDWTYAPVVPAISLSTTFEQEGPAQHRVSFQNFPSSKSKSIHIMDF